MLLLLCSTSVFGQTHFGLGIIAGQPTGLTAKLWLSPQTSIDTAVAWSFLNDGALYVHTDLQYYGFRLGGFGFGGIGLYAGIGGRYVFAESFRLGVRVPIGLIYVFRNVPLDMFLEGAPAVELIPATELTGGGAIGLRYYF